MEDDFELQWSELANTLGQTGLDILASLVPGPCVATFAHSSEDVDDRLPDLISGGRFHVRSIPWLKRLFSDTGLHLNAIRFLAVPMPQRKRVGGAPPLHVRAGMLAGTQTAGAGHRGGWASDALREMRSAPMPARTRYGRRFDVLMVWSIDRLRRSVLHVANALAELDAAGVALYFDQQAIASTTPMGRAMIQMASVFGEQEREIIRSRVNAGLDRVRAARQEAGPPQGVAEDRGRHQEASERRRRHPQGGSAGWMRRDRAASEAGDGREAGQL